MQMRQVKAVDRAMFHPVYKNSMDCLHYTLYTEAISSILTVPKCVFFVCARACVCMCFCCKPNLSCRRCGAKLGGCLGGWASVWMVLKAYA